MIDTFKTLLRDEEGQSMTEYILIVVLIAIAGIAAFLYFRGNVNEKVTDAGEELDKFSPWGQDE